MKILHVTGEDDFGALIFEQSNVTVEELYKKCMECGGSASVCIEREDEDEEGYEDEVYGTAYQFKDIDPEFIKFIKDYIMDYDGSKCENFYVVEEPKE